MKVYWAWDSNCIGRDSPGPFSQVLSGCSVITGLSQTNQTFSAVPTHLDSSDQMLKEGQQCCHELTDGETGPFGRYGSGSIRNGYPEYGALYIPPSWCLGTWSEKERQNNKSWEVSECVRCAITKKWTSAIVKPSYWTVYVCCIYRLSCKYIMMINHRSPSKQFQFWSANNGNRSNRLEIKTAYLMMQISGFPQEKSISYISDPDESF